MAQLSFKNVGVRADSIRNNPLVVNRSTLPIGIKTPLELVGGSTLFLTHTNIANQLEDNLRNLLLTNWGDRLAIYDFGANLQPLVTEYSNKDDFDTEAMVRINSTISKWMPFVSPIGFESFPDLEDNQFTGNIRIFLSYAIPRLNVKNKFLEINLFII